MVRIIDGHGLRTIRYPPSFAPTSLPSLSTTAASMPGKANEAEPGLSGVIGVGVIICIPVSVCHHVSTTGWVLPAIRRYQIQASGLIGSPTEPRIRRLERSDAPGQPSPSRISARMAVGAV